MAAETIGGHIVRSLKAQVYSLLDAEKKDKDTMIKAANDAEAELDRLIALLSKDA